MPRKPKPKPRKRRGITDRQLRALVFRCYENPELTADKHIQSMQKIFDWLKTGSLPEAPAKEKAPRVRLVHSQPEPKGA